MSQPTTASSGANGHSTVHDIFALSDEQILEIEPEPQDIEISLESQGTTQPAPVAPVYPEPQSAPSPAGLRGATAENEKRLAEESATKTANSEAPSHQTNGANANATANATAAAPFSTPEDLRAVADLYPGGLNQARTAAERARVLDEIDRSYFAAQANTPEQARASRAQLAAMMLREDPAAFREMVFEGLRALEAAEKQAPSSSNAANIPRLAQALRANQPGVNVAPPFRAASVDPQARLQTAELQPSHTSASEVQLAAYTAFEKSANAELEKSVGSAIDRALRQALPNLNATERSSSSPSVGGQHVAPLQERLSQAIREDVEKALQTDRQLGEQVAQILAGRRLDDATRALVVRLINDRALQLVPSAAKRALNEWTQTTLATHRSRTTRSDAPFSRREVPTAAPAPRDAQGGIQHAADRNEPRPASRSRVNYGRLSDEQILDM